MVVVFGRPGAGKTTVADRMVVLGRGALLGIDLDACVPQWMRDNFAKGVYPTREERAAFAANACDFVDEQIAAFASDDTDSVAVSFSFVNDDLRSAFRARFPAAKWVLVDTPPTTAMERVARRSGHFYKATPGMGGEWEFDDVQFPHDVLDGEAPIGANARAALAILRQEPSPEAAVPAAAAAAAAVIPVPDAAASPAAAAESINAFFAKPATPATAAEDINAFFSKNKSTEAASSSHANPTSSTATTEAEMGGLEQKQQQLLIALTGVATWLATSGSSTLPPPS